jgi:maltokinase
MVASDAGERPITVDQTNYSVVVGETVVVKWLLPPVPAPHRGVEVLGHLAAAGFTAMPAFFGEEVRGGSVHAIVTGFVPHALDGWDWCVDELTHSLLHDADRSTPLESVRRIAELTAHLHRAMATPTDRIPQPTALADLRAEADRGAALLAEATRELTGEAGRIVRDHHRRLDAAIEALRDAAAVPVQPIHGDLHVGQVLRAGDTMVLNDFDGDPVTGVDGHRALRSPLIDVASMIQSFDHVGRIVVKRRLPDHRAPVDAYITAATQLAHDTYASASGVDLTAVQQQLFGLRVVQELHEMIYAHRTLPRWMYVPEAALVRLLAG